MQPNSLFPGVKTAALTRLCSLTFLLGKLSFHLSYLDVLWVQMLLQSRASHTTACPALCQCASGTSSVCKPNQPPQTAQNIWATSIASSEMTQRGTKPKNETNKRLTHAHDSTPGFHLKCPMAVAEPTKAALRSLWAQGLRQNPHLHLHQICTGHPVCSTPALAVLAKSYKVLHNSCRRRRLFLCLACGSQVCWFDAELCKVQRELNSPAYIMKLLKSYPYN